MYIVNDELNECVDVYGFFIVWLKFMILRVSVGLVLNGYFWCICDFWGFGIGSWNFVDVNFCEMLLE